MNTNKLVSLRCANGQTAYDAIDEAIADGTLPDGVTLGPKELRGVGKQFVKPDHEILGSVAVRANEYYYIVRRLPRQDN